MTSKNLPPIPPIPPYYPAASEGGKIPQPGPGYPSTRDHPKITVDFSYPEAEAQVLQMNHVIAMCHARMAELESLKRENAFLRFKLYNAEHLIAKIKAMASFDAEAPEKDPNPRRKRKRNRRN